MNLIRISHIIVDYDNILMKIKAENNTERNYNNHNTNKNNDSYISFLPFTVICFLQGWLACLPEVVLTKHA